MRVQTTLCVLMSFAGGVAGQPVEFLDLGRREAAELIAVPVHLDFAEDVFWIRLSLPALSLHQGFVDLYSRFEVLMASTLTRPAATLFDSAGAVVYRFAQTGSWGQVFRTVGQRSPRRQQNIVNGDRGDDEGGCYPPFDGLWGPLADGEYWLAIANDIVGADDGWVVRVLVRPSFQAQRDTTLYIRVHPSEIPFCDPDLNWDGNADQDDVAYLIDVIANPPNGIPWNPCGADPDYNRDGNYDLDDVRALIDVIASGECPQ